MELQHHFKLFSASHKPLKACIGQHMVDIGGVKFKSRLQTVAAGSKNIFLPLPFFPLMLSLLCLTLLCLLIFETKSSSKGNIVLVGFSLILRLRIECLLFLDVNCRKILVEQKLPHWVPYLRQPILHLPSRYTRASILLVPIRESSIKSRTTCHTFCRPSPVILRLDLRVFLLRLCLLNPSSSMLSLALIIS